VALVAVDLRCLMTSSLSTVRPPWSSSLFPYTTLFRSAVVVLSGEHFVSAGMFDPGGGQIVGVQRLVHDCGVGSLAERVHECRRDVPRARPQRDAGDSHAVTDLSTAA